MCLFERDILTDHSHTPETDAMVLARNVNADHTVLPDWRLLAQAVDRRGIAVYCPKVLIKQVDVATGHLK
jgi:hypothetical protein